MIFNDKFSLRKQCRIIRRNISGKAEKDMAVEKKLLKEIQKYDTVLCYMSTDSEINTGGIIKFLSNHNITVAVPRICGDYMEFVKIGAASIFTVSKYGIQEPINGDTAILTDNSVCIVPGFAFTEKGERLGYGGGYYDRFLSQNCIRTVGLAYEELIFPEIPCEPHDIKVEKIITEERIVICNA